MNSKGKLLSNRYKHLFNVRGEPIVCTPQDAYRCFMRTEMDILVMQNHILLKLNNQKRG